MKSSLDVVANKGLLNRDLTFRQVQVLQSIVLFQKLHRGRSPTRSELCELLSLRHNQLYKALEGLYRRELLVKAWRKPDFVLTTKAQQVLLGHGKTVNQK